MRPKRKTPQSGHLFREPLRDYADPQNSLVKLADLIDWDYIDCVCSSGFTSKRGRPATSSRLIAGLLYLQHAYNLSDEAAVEMWTENHYWQIFTGETYFQSKAPIDPSSLTRWRKRLGEKGMEALLAATIATAKKVRKINEQSMQETVTDTTVMPKAIAYPTDAGLLLRSWEHLVRFARKNGIVLRQNFNRTAPRLFTKISRHGHAKRYDEMKQLTEKLRECVIKVCKDIERQKDKLSGVRLTQAEELLQLSKQVQEQTRYSKDKIYSIHAPEVECISKGKVRNRYEFGVKVSVTTTLKEGFVLGVKAMPGYPYDGHTLEEGLRQAERLSGADIALTVVDKGYKGAKIAGIEILTPWQLRNKDISKKVKNKIKRRSIVEPMIGHMKADGKLNRNWLKGTEGDAIHAILCGAGHNIRLLLRWLRLFYTWIFIWVLGDWGEKSAIVRQPI